MDTKDQQTDNDSVRLNKQFIDEDADPAIEKGKGEQVTPADLKGKSVDADPGTPAGQPVDNGKSN